MREFDALDEAKKGVTYKNVKTGIKQRKMKPLIRLLWLMWALVAGACAASSDLPELADVLEANPSLQRVLDHCKEDSLKYRAAEFLLENLPYHYSYEGEVLDNYLKLYELHGQGTMYPEDVLDSIKRAYGPFRLETLTKRSDIYADPDYLIDNIEWAFKVWREQPWGKNVSFEDFCEYILPYRVGNERLEPWRKEVYERYNPLLDSIRGLPEAEDPLFVSQVLLDSLQDTRVYFTSLFSFGPHPGPRVTEWRSGNCQTLTGLQLYVFRAVGLPCSEEFMMVRGNANVDHYWNGVFDREGNVRHTSVLYDTPVPQDPEQMWDPKGKVYRRTFSVNRKVVEEMGVGVGERYPSFRYPCFKDVTATYAGRLNHGIHVPADSLYRRLDRKEPVYLCVARYLDWEPVAWSRTVGRGGVSFRDVEGGVVFRLATYDAGELHPLCDPFLLDRDTGELRFFPSGGKLTEVTLLHKYELYFEPFVTRMVQGVFEGSNDPHFRQKDTLFCISAFPERLWNVAAVEKRGRKYRYLRYYGPAESHCNVAEVAFYEQETDTVPLKGRVIGTPGASDDKHECTNVFDGDPYTSFDYAQPSGGWAGLDLGKPHAVRKIVFTPRNRDNFIRTDDEYELFYCDRGSWMSAGVVHPSSDSLLYQVPQGSLLYLKDHTRGKDERIFEYTDGKQRFW